MEDKLLNYFENLYTNNKIGHAYLICNCDMSFIYDELTKVLSKYIFEYDVDIRNNEDIILIEPENDVIKKEKILGIHESVSITSQTHDKKVYIINQCEKMNEFAANSLLKLLEEPEKNIYAILISTNVLNVLKTIYSRCQILSFYNQDVSKRVLNELTDEEYSEIISFINKMEDKGVKVITDYNYISKNIKDKLFFKKFLNVTLLIYRDILNIKLNKNTEYFDNCFDIMNKIANNNSVEQLVKKLTKINSFIEYIDYNLNVNLLLDRFIIELVGEEYE